jgi:hypothetical protein
MQRCSITSLGRLPSLIHKAYGHMNQPFSLHIRWEIQLIGYTLERPKILMNWWANMLYIHVISYSRSLHTSWTELCVKASHIIEQNITLHWYSKLGIPWHLTPIGHLTTKGFPCHVTPIATTWLWCVVRSWNQSWMPGQSEMVAIQLAGRFPNGIHNFGSYIDPPSRHWRGKYEKRIYCRLVNFRKVFDTIPHAQLMKSLETLEVPKEIQWEIYAHYELVSTRARTPNGLLGTVASTTTVKAGCPLSFIFT